MQCTDLIYRVAQKIVSYRTLSVSSLNIDHFHNFLPVDSVRNLLLILDSNRHTENPRFRLSDLHYVRLLQIFKKMLNAHCIILADQLKIPTLQKLALSRIS